MISNNIIQLIRSNTSKNSTIEIQFKNVSKRSYKTLENYLNQYPSISQRQTDYIQNISKNSMIRRSITVPNNPIDLLQSITTQKQIIAIIPIENYDFNIVISSLEQTPKKQNTDELIRTKDKKIYNVGLNKVILSKSIQNEVECNGYCETIIEVEIQLNTSNLSDSVFSELNYLVETIWSRIHDSILIYTTQEMQKTKEYLSDVNVYIEPVMLTKDELRLELVEKVYRGSMKIDGTRKWLVSDETGIWLVMPKYDEYSLLSRRNYQDFFVMDGELTNDGIYHIFDLLKYQQTTPSDDLHTVRLQKVQNIIDLLRFESEEYQKLLEKQPLTESNTDRKGDLFNPEIDLPITLKTLSFVTLTYDSIFDVFEYYSDKKSSPEGMVLVPNNTSLKSYKWKHPERTTIDVRIIQSGNEYEIFGLKDDSEELITTAKILDPKGLLSDIDIDTIVELGVKDSEFIIERIRYDKVRPNRVEIITQILDYLKDPITVKSLVGRNTFYIDLFHQKLVEGMNVNFQYLDSYDTKLDESLVVISDYFDDISKVKELVGERDVLVIIFDRERIEQMLDPIFYGVVFSKLEFELEPRIELSKKDLNKYGTLSEYISVFGSPVGGVRIPDTLLTPVQRILIQGYSIGYFKGVGIDNMIENSISS